MLLLFSFQIVIAAFGVLATSLNYQTKYVKFKLRSEKIKIHKKSVKLNSLFQNNYNVKYSDLLCLSIVNCIIVK